MKDYESTLYEDLGFCGCGNPDSVAEMVAAYLRAKSENDPYFTRERVAYFINAWGEQLFLYMAYTLDDKEYTDHGASVYGAWTTDKGKSLLRVLEKGAANDS